MPNLYPAAAFLSDVNVPITTFFFLVRPPDCDP
jgi:hypothetical protein